MIGKVKTTKVDTRLMTVQKSKSKSSQVDLRQISMKNPAEIKKKLHEEKKILRFSVGIRYLLNLLKTKENN